MKKKLFFILLVLCQIKLIGGSTDSIEMLKDSLTQLVNDTTIASDVRIQRINDLSFGLVNKDPDLALHFVNEALQLNRNVLQSSKEFSNSYTILGIIHKNKGFYELAVTNYLEALKHAESTGDSSRISVCLNNIGVVFQLNHKEVKALEYYKRSVDIERRWNNNAQLSIRYYNIAESYQELQQFDSAFYYYSKSLLIEELNKSPDGIAYARYGLSTLFYVWKKYNKCEQHLIIARNLTDSIEDVELKIKIRIANADLNTYKKEYAKAQKELEFCMNLAREYEYKDLEIKSLERLKSILEQTNDSKNLIYVLNRLYEAQKSKTTAEVTNKLASLQKLYNLEVQSRELDRLKSVEKVKTLEVYHARKIRNFLFGALVIVIGIFAFNIYRLNRMRKKDQE